MNKKKKKISKKSLLLSLHFNLEMNPSIKKALHDAGMDTLDTSRFPELEAWRQQVAEYGRSVAAIPTPYDKLVTIKDEFISAEDTATIRLRFYRPNSKQDPLPVFYWMHGGGMMGGTPEQDDGQMKQISVEANILVVSVDYRVAPEFPFPVPLNDCYEGLKWLVKHSEKLGIDATRIAVGGASAGGGLAASLALKLKNKRWVKIIHQSLTYPMLDDRNQTNSSHQITSLGPWDRSYNLYGWKAYLGTKHHRKYVPALAVPSREKDLSGLPSVFIAVGALDLFRDEDIEYALRLMEAGVLTELHFYQGAVHGFDWYIPADPITKTFIHKRISALKMALTA